jgi:hypothetical protein
MPSYPIKVPRGSYRGRDPARLRRAERFDKLAERLERYINERAAACTEEIQIFAYRKIALELGIPEAEVEKVLYGVDCGGNGLTVVKRRP